MNMGYAREKVVSAIQTLTTGKGRIKDRLLDATHHALVMVMGNTSYMPEGIRSDVEWLNDKLTKHKAEGSEGTFKATLDKMSEDEAVEIASVIFDLGSKLECTDD